MLKKPLSLALVLALHASAALAQPPTARVNPVATPGSDSGYVEVNIGLQASSTSFDITNHPLDFVEPATVHTTYNVKGAQALDFGGGVRVAHSLAVGASFSRFQKGGDVTVDAQVPHPFFFNRPRSVTGTAADVTRQETALHIKVVYMPPTSGGWQFSLSGGPSFFKVGQDIVEDVTLDDVYPFDTANFKGVVATRHDASGLGFNVGADITRLFTPHMGVGAAVTFSRAKLNIDTGDDATTSIDAGGVRIGGGLRFRF